MYWWFYGIEFYDDGVDGFDSGDNYGYGDYGPSDAEEPHENSDTFANDNNGDNSHNYENDIELYNSRFYCSDGC